MPLASINRALGDGGDAYMVRLRIAKDVDCGRPTVLMPEYFRGYIEHVLRECWNFRRSGETRRGSLLRIWVVEVDEVKFTVV